MKQLFAACTLIGASTAFAVAANAQDEAGDRVNMVIAYSEDECPEAAEGEIVVCEILVESERYRIPSTLRTSDNPENRAWTRRVESLRMIGAFGTLSCSPTGAGGITGCTQQMIDAAYADRSEGSKVRFAQLIEQARAERLSTIDEDAAAEQDRVEQIEREYLERLERERSAALPGEESAPALIENDEAAVEPTTDAEPPAEGPVAEPEQ